MFKIFNRVKGTVTTKGTRTHKNEIAVERVLELLSLTNLEGLTATPYYDKKYSRVGIYYTSGDITITHDVNPVHFNSAELTAQHLLLKIEVYLEKSKKFLEDLPTTIETLKLLDEQVKTLKEEKK